VLIAANAPKPFSKILACEKDPQLCHACKTRLVSFGASAQCDVFRGDCNVCVEQIASRIPDGALTLAFIDPTGLHARFDTIARLSQRGRVDLLVLFADRNDIVRNVDLYEHQGADSNLDQVLGPDSNWRDAWKQLTNRTAPNISKMFADIYKNQLKRHLGYIECAEKTMSSAQGPKYRLMYASKHERGLEFWHKITKKDVHGQREMF
jgi:three-Cys-motif partner protein